MLSIENLSSTQRTRAALHRDVRTIGTETCHFLGLEITKPAMEIVSELVYKKLSVYGADLEAFAKHAKRSTINADDVKLLVRRCPSLVRLEAGASRASAFNPGHTQAVRGAFQKNHLNIVAPSPKEKRRKTTSKAPETPASKPKEPEVSTSKQKEPEIPTSKQKDTEDSNKKDNQQDGKAEMSMEIDDMIDLTFD